MGETSNVDYNVMSHDMNVQRESRSNDDDDEKQHLIHTHKHMITDLLLFSLLSAPHSAGSVVCLPVRLHVTFSPPDQLMLQQPFWNPLPP